MGVPLRVWRRRRRRARHASRGPAERPGAPTRSVLAQCAVTWLAGLPAGARDIPDPPPVLWVQRRGRGAARPRTVAIVGARAASRRGSRSRRQSAPVWRRRRHGRQRPRPRRRHGGPSRRARAGGRSVAVLGSGLDRVYPPEHERWRHSWPIRRVVSECPPGTPPLPHHFPLRNRIISGLAAATVVVEASEQSGSLITADAALEQGREVMAVPGSVCTAAIAARTRCCATARRWSNAPPTCLTALGWGGAAGRRRTEGRRRSIRRWPPNSASTPATGDFDADEIAAATGWSPGCVCAKLGALEMAGRIQRSAAAVTWDPGTAC